MTQPASRRESFIGNTFLNRDAWAVGRSTFAASRCVVPFEEEDDSPFVGLLQVEAA
jgi:hypothetical protein